MFEKEADEIAVNNAKKKYGLEGSVYMNIQECAYVNGFQEGAEFGYNKANEWHYNGIPHDNKPYLCKVVQPTKREMSEFEILFFDDKEMSWFRWLTLWSGKEGNEIARVNRKVIAWKEIVLPELKESE